MIGVFGAGSRIGKCGNYLRQPAFMPSGCYRAICRLLDVVAERAGVEPESEREGNRSRAKAAQFRATRIAAQTAKNSPPASNRDESFMSLIPLARGGRRATAQPRAFFGWETATGGIRACLTAAGQQLPAGLPACASACGPRDWLRFPSSWPAGPASAPGTFRCECGSFAP